MKVTFNISKKRMEQCLAFLEMKQDLPDDVRETILNTEEIEVPADVQSDEDTIQMELAIAMTAVGAIASKQLDN